MYKSKKEVDTQYLNLILIFKIKHFIKIAKKLESTLFIILYFTIRSQLSYGWH